MKIAFLIFFQNLSTEYENFRGIQVDAMYFLYVMFSPDTKVLISSSGSLALLAEKVTLI